MSDDAVTFEVTRLNSAEAIGALLKAAGALSDRFGFVEGHDPEIGAATAPLDLVRDHLVDESVSHDWPGTSSHDLFIVRHFSVNPTSVAILRRFMEKLLYEGKWPVPGDLHFIRSDNSPVLVTISSHDDLWFRFEPGDLDLVEKSTFELLGLRKPLDPPLTHTAAAWADRADCVVEVPIGDEEDWVEAVPCLKLTRDTYEVCCIPFRAELALGDVVEATESNGILTMTGKLAPSGREVAEVEVSLIRESPHDIVSLLVAAGFLVEWSGDRLIVVNLDHDADVDVLTDLLLESETPYALSMGLR